MPNAAVGQSGMQALYETMFRNYGILVGQVLVTKPDFQSKETKKQLFRTIDELLQLNIIPIINTNDAVSPPPQKDEDPEGKLITISISIIRSIIIFILFKSIRFRVYSNIVIISITRHYWN